MVIRIAGRSVTVKEVTPQTVRKAFDLANTERQLKEATQKLANASGPSLALRRLRERVARLDQRYKRLSENVAK